MCPSGAARIRRHAQRVPLAPGRLVTTTTRLAEPVPELLRQERGRRGRVTTTGPVGHDDLDVARRIGGRRIGGQRCEQEPASERKARNQLPRLPPSGGVRSLRAGPPAKPKSLKLSAVIPGRATIMTGLPEESQYIWPSRLKPTWLARAPESRHT